MKIFSYKTVLVPQPNLEKALNEYGSKGFELVQVVSTMVKGNPALENMQCYLCFFKKEGSSLELTIPKDLM